MFAPLLTLSLVTASFWPRPERTYENELLKSLRPRADFLLRWRETWERSADFSGAELGVSLGVFPKHPSGVRGGLELGTEGTRPSRLVPLGDGFAGKSVSFHQVFVAYENEWFLGQAGKFQDALWTSPLALRSDLALEGFFQNVKLLEDSLQIFALQGLLEEGSSWILVQGLRGVAAIDETTELKWSVSSFFLVNPSEALAERSAARGNTLERPGVLASDYVPVEMALQVLGRPFGISTGLVGAAILNLGTSDQQRGFFAQGFIGTPWERGGWVTAASYLYSEPDVSFALLTDEDYGSTNRKGFRAEVSYFPASALRVGASFGLFQVIQSHPSQKLRRELSVDTQLIF